MVEGKRHPSGRSIGSGDSRGPIYPVTLSTPPPLYNVIRNIRERDNSIGDEPRSPSGFFLHGSPMASIARVFNGVFGVGAPVWATSSSEQARRREFIKADAEPLMRVSTS